MIKPEAQRFCFDKILYALSPNILDFSSEERSSDSIYL